MAAVRPTSALNRNVPPPPGEIRPFRFPPFLWRKLPGGLEVLAARLPSVPLVLGQLVFPAGGQHDPEDRRGLATLTASLIDEGTSRRSALDIADLIEQWGGYLSTGADWDSGFIAVGLLTDHLERGLDLVAELATSPSFPDNEIERLRKQRLAELLRRSHDPSYLADERLAEVVYQGTIYSQSLLGTPESVGGLDREAVLEFYRRHCTLNGSALVAVGDLDPEELVRLAERIFLTSDLASDLASEATSATPGEPPAAPAIRPAPLAGISVHIVDRPGAAQTELRLGHVGVARTHPDYIPLAVLNTLLGGKFTSRINMNLRERHGFTYVASSRFTGRQGPGPFVVEAAVATESTGAACREVLGELRRIREEPVEVQELEDTRNYLMGVFPYTAQTIGDIAKRLETMAVYRLPEDYYLRYPERVSEVTREDVLRVAREHIHPDDIAVVAVGPAEALEPQLAELGPVTVRRRESDAAA